MKRRHFLAATSLPLLGCGDDKSVRLIAGDFTGIAVGRGHLLQGGKAWPAPSVIHKTRVVIAGGGVAGLAAARALRLKGMDDFALLELEDEAGGNSRGGVVGGIPCPLGAHYLPVPGDDAPAVQNLLEELGLRQRVMGRWQIDERHLCHSPQERLFLNGEWQPGLLPVQGVGADTLAQYAKFSALIAQAQTASKWTIPVSKWPVVPATSHLFAITFDAYLSQNGLTDPHLRWYLNYCCRDDYGAGIATVSAWAGIHYFASRHGFHAPGSDNNGEGGEREGVLTWPEGNAWLTRQLAAPLTERLHTGWVVLRVADVKHGVEVDAFNPAQQLTHRWLAERCINALPIFIAARTVENPPDFLRAAAAQTRYAPWLVANIHINAPLLDRPGPAPAWDNVIYLDAASGTTSDHINVGAGLGYVDAMHQSLRPVPGATVLTHYRALGDVPHGRKLLMDTPWTTWRDTLLAELGVAHPDIARKTTRIDITRYGHAMAVPIPEIKHQIGLKSPSNINSLLFKKERFNASRQRITYAHSDWAGYSVFEEAFTLGHQAGHQAG